MIKLPPIEKIPEAYSAIQDNRVSIFEEYATVKSSNGEKEYLIKWRDNVFYSNDNSTYWQGYPGYPVIAVLLLQGKLPLNREILHYFANVDWNSLNKETKRDYRESVNRVLSDVADEDKELIFLEFEKVFEAIKKLDIELTKKKDL
ncbi:MAG: hypothetical protein K2G03_03310 [Bacilli bacterium]|nr:hypothetical protein [Bacilli bacterium]